MKWLNGKKTMLGNILVAAGITVEAVWPEYAVISRLLQGFGGLLTGAGWVHKYQKGELKLNQRSE